MKTVALLPMKANSERVPGKNFKKLNGRPLYEWVLTALLDCEVIDEIVINTDAWKELFECGFVENDRVKIRDRKPELCGDEVSMNLILRDDIDAVPADQYLMTHTTNPLLSTETMEQAIADFRIAIEAGDADSLFGVTKHQTRFYFSGGKAINHDPNNLIRTQDLEPYYEENSCIYIFSRQSFEKTNARIGTKPIMFEIPKIEAVDIDQKEDWFIASALVKGVGDTDNYV